MQVCHGVQSAAGIKGVVALPVTAEDGVVDTAETVAVFLPTFDAAAVLVGTQGELGVAWLAYAETVGVAERGG